jgi:hypothetical protein
MRRTLALLALVAATLVVAVPASAAGGGYVFDGGTAKQQATVRAALAASSFDWTLLPEVTIHIARGSDSFAKPGEVWLDADLLDSGRFAWGTVQHELAHQIDFFLLDAQKRAILHAALGGSDWCYETAGLAHDAHGCERFADTVAAAYWVSPDNTAKASIAAPRFRTLLNGLLGAQQRTLAGVKR